MPAASGSQQVTFDSGRQAVAVNATASDVQLATPCRAFYCGVSGSATVRFARDTADVTLVGLVAGQVYPLRISIFRSGAPASIVALY